MKEVPEENLEKNSDKNPETSLPEGFFDDPEIDAKIRGVETPSSAMDREWEDFQREIQKETGQSEQIVEEEEETGKVDREVNKCLCYAIIFIIFHLRYRSTPDSWILNYS